MGQAKDAGAAYTAGLLSLLGSADPFAVQAALVSAVEQLVEGLTKGELVQPEQPGKWSMMQVLGHLVDTEVVYAYRVRMILSHDRPDIPGYDQDRWAEQLRYREANLPDVLNELRVLRNRNLRLLRLLSDAELDRYGMHSERGPESVRRIVSLIAAHDLVHRRQLQRIRDLLKGNAVGD